jgi:hypothetical protein
MTTTDFWTGLDPAREWALKQKPDVPMYAENYMVSSYDPSADIGMWLHLGTWPEDFELWEDFFVINLPDDMLWFTSWHRTAVADRPAGSALRFECIEPWRRWRYSYDGIVHRSPRSAMLDGRLRNGGMERLTFDLDAECVTPIWDAHASATSAHGSGSMKEQVWASEHYQQLFRLTGTMRIHGVGDVPIDTTGVRDHSRGQRGGGMDKWGGHTLIHVLFPSGKAFALQMMWLPDGTVSLDTAYVLIDGEFQHASGKVVPRLDRLNLGGDEMRLVLESDIGLHELTGTVIRNSFLTPQRLGMAVGADADGPYGIMAMGHARWEWDGEVSYGLTERSRVGLGWDAFDR